MELCFYIIDINRLWLVIVEGIFHEKDVDDVTFLLSLYPLFGLYF